MRTIVIVYALVLVLGCIGWVKNVVHLCQCDFDPIGKAEVLYGVSTFIFPVGAVMGYIDLGK